MLKQRTPPPFRIDAVRDLSRGVSPSDTCTQASRTSGTAHSHITTCIPVTKWICALAATDKWLSRAPNKIPVLRENPRIDARDYLASQVVSGALNTRMNHLNDKDGLYRALGADASSEMCVRCP